jgi:hypothetical protein
MRCKVLAASVAAVALTAALSISPAAAAQEGSPVAVDPAECVVELRTVDEFVVMFARDGARGRCEGPL